MGSYEKNMYFSPLKQAKENEKDFFPLSLAFKSASGKLMQGNGKCILALPAPEEGNVVDVRKSKRKKEEADNRKRLIESPFSNDYGKKGVSDLNTMFGSV